MTEDTLIWIAATVLGIVLSILARSYVLYILARRNASYPFYLTDCSIGTQIIINAHHFKRTLQTDETELFEFFNGNGDIVFSSTYMWTNIYRGEKHGSEDN